MTLAESVGTELRVPEGLELRHHSPTIGTEVLGIDLRAPLADDVVVFLRALFLERKVLFFRDQDITTEDHMAFCRHWGELEVIPFLPQHPDHPEVLVIERGEGNRATENIWHSDVTWRERPSLGSALRSREVPEVGGDTLWADAELAYETLSAPLKRAVEGLEAEHSIATSLSVYMDDDTMHEMLKTFPPVRHPVVRTHPETGRKSLYVNLAHTMRILDVPREDSRMLLRELANHFRTPELQCRFRWTDNAIAFWDNRSTQHYAVQDYYPAVRRMERVTVQGDRPV